MSRDPRALLMVIPLLFGCLVLAAGNSKNTGFLYFVLGRTIPDATLVRGIEGNPTALACDMLGSVADFGWRKIRGRPTSEENLKTLTETWCYNKTYSRTSLYFPNFLKRDEGTYECWANDDENLTTSSGIILSVDRNVNYVQLPLVALNQNEICVKWKISCFLCEDLVTSLRIESQENESREWRDVYQTSVKFLSGVYIAERLNEDTDYWFKFIWGLKYSGNVVTFSGPTKTLKRKPLYLPIVSVRETSVDSITIEWPEPPLEIENCFERYKVIMYESNSREGLRLMKSEVIGNTYRKFENLRTSAAYTFELRLCTEVWCQPGETFWLKDIVPKDRDPKFTPNVSVVETGVASATIAWNAPPANFEDRIYYYKLALDNGDFQKELYVNKTENSHTFKNLPPNTTHRFKVAACSDYKTQCGNWSEERKAFIHVTDSTSVIEDEIWLITGAIAVHLVFVVVTMLVRNYRRKALKRKIIKARLENFNFRARISLDPELAVSDQAELLPYNKKWEFPRDLLKLDEVLGSGAFGVVRMGHAKTISSRETVTTVAVKTVRPTANLKCMKALYRELKILVYLGQHLNIVNLLGACTKNIDLGELLVIVEYCRYGNLHDYLIRRRVNFVNQLNSSGEKISVSAACEDAMNIDDVGINTDRDCDGNSTIVNCPSDITSTTTNARVEDCSTSGSLLRLTAPLKYPGDQTDFNSRPTCTSDLVCWAWQVSCGMQYISEKKIIHGDLATRNILLTDDNVVKICDFGLSKSLREEENQTSTENGPLPVKWMAIESLRDRVFSTKSDVWSFGVVLWELFSLARTPYPLIRPEEMCQKLAEGYRMEKPQYASRSIYQMMLRCWKVEPAERPSFERLKIDISALIEEHVKTFYLDLGNPYTRIYGDIWNRERETPAGAEESGALREDS
ncbi:macrophage colony-stimulating factor 1 receptor 2-like [Diprion similis]|uniref:macrophage colony-stimulating factor 1 receptor 2-like n=1 Tax=Diprion similis TaxID=362088 RepID=UPI001EF95BB2|nr:macrophage colony-stimulating factor 1 receptor 2-like [Diprion similis]